MNYPGKIKIEDYNYPLTDDKIAKYPLPARDESKLLYFDGNEPVTKKFIDLPELLPENALLLFNTTKVVNARLLFKKETGATIEIFCLEPISPVNDFQLAFQQRMPVTWKCLIGNAKRWKSGVLKQYVVINDTKIEVRAEKDKQLSEGYLVKFSWDSDMVSFGEIISKTGMIPIPPYLNRKAEQSDLIRYQTIYATNDGSVAAPTAGLHFTDEVFFNLKNKGIQTNHLTLHVGAGTFKPVVSNTIEDHEMHTEKIVVSIDSLNHILNKINDPIIPVGTTSMRTLESLYWMALKIHNGASNFDVNQWDPYEMEVNEGFTPIYAIKTLIAYLRKNNITEIKGQTRLIIAPGYKFRFANGLITNFHQPKSTLLLLVSALIGNKWQAAYDFALKNNFRFLSYGDSCLFL